MSARRLALALLCCLCLGALAAPGAQAEPAPAFRLAVVANTAAAPKSQVHLIVEAVNRGAAPTAGTFTLQASLPAGLTPLAATPLRGPFWSGSPPCAIDAGARTVTCTASQALAPNALNADDAFTTITAKVTAPAGESLRAAFTISGGGAAPATAVKALRVSPEAAPFGIEAFDGLAATAAGAAETRAGSHPYVLSNNLDLTSETNPTLEDTAAFPGAADAYPVEAVRDIGVDLPPGLLGNPGAFPRCSVAELIQNDGGWKPTCDPASQLGVVYLKFNLPGANFGRVVVKGPYSLYNLDPSFGAPARFGFVALGSTAILSARLRPAASGGGYAVSVDSTKISEGLGLVGTEVEFWGAPGAAAHDAERGCQGKHIPVEGGPICALGDQGTALLRLPSSCTAPGEGLAWGAAADSWVHPGSFEAGGAPAAGDPAWARASFESHEPPVYPQALPGEGGAPRGTEECANVPFSPQATIAATSESADSPSGLTFDLQMPQQGLTEAGAISEADVKRVAVALPEGMTINPSAAGGRGACTPAQIGLLSGPGQPPRFNAVPQSCPDDAKIGTATLQTPLLPEGDSTTVQRPLHGAVYLASQGQNPFGSLLALYLAIEDPKSGVVLKLPGQVIADPQTGRLETVFENSPQAPFSQLQVDLFGGRRAPLRTPSACGTYTATASLAPWSGNAPVSQQSPIAIDKGCGAAFDPKFQAGTRNPLAGAYSPWGLRLTREDGEGEFGSLSLREPPGFSGNLTGIPYCPEATLAAVSSELGTGLAQEQHPSCPAASQVGTVTVGAGAGPTPFYTSAGRAYLAGPYKGAPLSIAVITPAVAGPFDLGTVVVRNAVYIDPQTAQLKIDSDPLPRILHGIPLDLRDVRIDLTRERFIFNPTSCEPMGFQLQVASTAGASASPVSPYQAAACDRLGFKPRLSLKLAGSTERGGNPALTALLRPRPGDANLSRVQVALPHSEFLDQGHIKTICTRVQFAAGSGGGAACPAGSVYGKATATTPILDQPLTGNVYLRSSSNKLPDLVLALHGPPSQPIAIEAVGRIDSIRGGIRTTFESTPDAPLTRVLVKFPAGKKSLLQNSTDICAAPHRAAVQLDAHNNKTADLAVPLRAKCPKAKQGKKARHRGARR